MKRIMMAVAATAFFVLGSFGGATASGLIQHRDLADNSVHSDTIRGGSIHTSDLAGGMQGRLARLHTHSLDGAIYRIANYTNGGGGRATVACADTEAESVKYTAIAGGAYVNVGDGSSTDTEPITSSRPGRMDWDTNTPKPDRLDGWIVNFGAGTAPSDNPGDLLQVWALCVPDPDISVVSTDY